MTDLVTISPDGETSETAPKDADSGASTPQVESFLAYIVRRFVVERQWVPGVCPEARVLAEKSHVVLSLAKFGLLMACFLDRAHDPSKRFTFSQEELIAIGRDCLEYCGTFNGAKMPVAISLYEIGHGPPSAEDIARLRALQKSMPGLAKVVIQTFYLDTQSGKAWGGSWAYRLRRRLGLRDWVETALQDPHHRAPVVAPVHAALPSRKRLPVATIGMLALLAALFVVEQIAKVGTQADGLLGVNVGSLFALGGMNAEAVLKDGEWYRLLSAALLHGDAIHLLLNGLALGLAGVVLEAMVGRAWLVLLFVVGAIGGSLMGLALNPSNLVSVGASGAAMGLLSAALVTTSRLPDGAEKMQMRMQLLQFLIPSLLPLATHRAGGQIDYAAHFGGAIAGVLCGYGILKIWPRDRQKPRFDKVTKGLAAVAIGGVLVSLVFVKSHYGALAADASFAPAEVLVADGAIPKDVAVAKRDVEIWGKDRPRDPRVHLFRALRLLDEERFEPAEAELRAALAEREILDRAFGNRKLEIQIRTVLCAVLVERGEKEEAKRIAEPVCKANAGETPSGLKPLGVCD